MNKFDFALMRVYGIIEKSGKCGDWKDNADYVDIRIDLEEAKRLINFLTSCIEKINEPKSPSDQIS